MMDQSTSISEKQSMRHGRASFFYNRPEVALFSLFTQITIPEKKRQYNIGKMSLIIIHFKR
jgi:hypothetical protein